MSDQPTPEGTVGPEALDGATPAGSADDATAGSAGDSAGAAAEGSAAPKPKLPRKRRATATEAVTEDAMVAAEAPEVAPAMGSEVTAAPEEPVPLATAHDGFWLPAALRARLISANTRWEETCFVRGRECAGGRLQAGTVAGAPSQTGAVFARWPHFTEAQWTDLIEGLQDAREKAPRGGEYWHRLQAALSVAARRLTDPSDPLHRAVSQALPGFTGYSPGMIAATLGMPDLWDLQDMVPALRYHPNKVCSVRWQRLPGLPGRIRFFPSNPFDRLAGWLPVAWEMPLYRSDTRPRTVLGYGTSIPGGALTTAFLALSVTLRGEAPLPRPVPPPAVLLCNSREEPILTPVVLSAIEEIDPDLVSMVAATVWDRDDAALQKRLVGAADLVLGSADPPGRKLSFTVIGREMLEPASLPGRGGGPLAGGTETIDVVTLLAGLDSVFWDQNGGLSSRIHFVEQDGPADDLPAEYARRLTLRLRQIARVIPRGAWPVRHLRDPFDRYRALEGSDRWGTGLQVMSEYDDPFVVIFDGRTGSESRQDPSAFAALVDECRTRVVVVRPVADLMEVPWRYLRLLPRRSLRSLSVAVGRPGEGLTKPFLDFGAACGAQGVTAIRIVGRGAFPRPAYSWDGSLPVDLVGRRPPGYFTTIEFDAPFEEMLQLYRAHLTRLAALAEAQSPSRRA